MPRDNQSIRSRAKTASLIESIASVNTSVVPISMPIIDNGNGVIKMPNAAKEPMTVMSQSDAATMIGAGRERQNLPRSRST